MAWRIKRWHGDLSKKKKGTSSRAHTLGPRLPCFYGKVETSINHFFPLHLRRFKKPVKSSHKMYFFSYLLRLRPQPGFLPDFFDEALVQRGLTTSWTISIPNWEFLLDVERRQRPYARISDFGVRMLFRIATLLPVFFVRTAQWSQIAL